MTPVEDKAKKLVEKFGYCAGTYMNVVVLGIAKRSAKLCCDEVIAEIEDLQQNCVMEFPMALEFWTDVKSYIEKL